MGEVIAINLKFRYNGDFSGIRTMEELRTQVIVNAICMTSDINHAAKEAGVDKRSIFRFLREHDLTVKECWDMRRDFRERKIKVRRRYYGY